MTQNNIPSFNPSAMLSFDLETTGINPRKAKIVTSALVKIQGSQREDYEMLADPGVEIPEEASRVHGITTEKARAEGRPHDEVLGETIARIRHAWSQGFGLVVYNATYDLTILRALEPSFTIDGLVIDPLVIDKAKVKRPGKRTLALTSEYHGVPLDNAHQATSDAVAAARVAWKLAQSFPELTEMTGEELMVAQSRWFYESQTRLQQWFKEKGKDIIVDTSWPIAG